MADPNAAPRHRLPGDGRCVDSDCSVCRDAGLEWKSGFCDPGHWTPKPTATGPLNSRVWSKLPVELLENIFARLPTDAIGRVRCLSKEWRRVASSSSTFTGECAKVQPNLWAMIGSHDDPLDPEPARMCWVRAYDSQACKWHAFETESIPQLYRNAIRVFDGGLACFVPCGLGEDHQPILVCNPLTGEWKQLPLSRLVGNQPRMAQLRVDRDKGTYKVIVVGHVGVAPELKKCWEENKPLAAEVYDSETKEWNALVSGEVLGSICWWHRASPIPRTIDSGPFVYDCATRELKEYRLYGYPFRCNELGVITHWEEAGFASCVNDLYLLEALPHSVSRVYGEGVDRRWYNVLKHEEGNWGFGPYCERPEFRGIPNEIFENVRMNQRCGPVIQLLVCKAFFMMIGKDLDDGNRYFMRLYDLEKRKSLEDFYFDCHYRYTRHSLSKSDMWESGICELRWDACP